MKLKQILKNFGFNLGGSALPIAVSLITVPAYLHHLGEVRYGILTFVWTLVGYFGILDLGISRATANRISKTVHSDMSEVHSVFWSAIYLNTALGVVGGVLFYFSGDWILHHLVKAPDSYQLEIARSVLWIAVAIPIVNLSAVLGGALEGAERFGIYNGVQFIGTLGVQILPLIAGLMVGPSLEIVVPAAALARAVTCVMLAIVVRNTFELGLLGKFSRARAFDLLHFGKWVVTSSSVRVLAENADRFAVGSIIGAAALSTYGIPQNLIGRCMLMPNALARTMFPRFSNSAPEDAHRLCLQVLRIHGYIYTACLVVALWVVKPFLILWVGHSFAADAIPVARLLILSVWAAGQSVIVIAFLQAIGQPNVVAKLSLFETPLLLVAIWFGASHFGLNGVAIVVVLRNLCDALVLVWRGGLLARGALPATISALFLAFNYALTLEDISMTVQIACTVVSVGTLITFSVGGRLSQLIKPAVQE
ncbi:polysaccharide biosynthesis family protein [Burkholderia cenocepacia]|uniref:Polysaccharide biosynthesis family protein n=1 Tax=Burkholderia cenocepacia TaxID=95486 RepID=A0AAN0VK26_9BURK|nr:polysaccharide biosynthesis family protein [Burkholderia cenocepacia]